MARPWLIGALFASLALNVFVVGVFIGSRLEKADPPARAGAATVRSPVMMAVRTLTPEQQAAWRAEGPAFNQTYAPKAREARRLARETLRGLGDERFDAETARTELARARALEHEARVAMDQRLVAFAGTLPPDARKRFADALARPALSRGDVRDRQGVALRDR